MRQRKKASAAEDGYRRIALIAERLRGETDLESIQKGIDEIAAIARYGHDVLPRRTAEIELIGGK